MAKKPKSPKARPLKKTTPQEEMTHLGVIVNLMNEMDREAQTRALRYLNDRFNG